MSDLLSVHVLRREGPVVTLRVRLLPAESGPFCTSREFAWMLIDPRANEDAFEALDPAALDACRAAVDAMDEENMESTVRRRLQHCLLTNVTISDVGNYTEERPRHLWEQAADAEAEEALYPYAVYQITTARPELCGHLPVGFEWRSSAFDELGTGEFLPYPEPPLTP